jgi:ATP-binding cassette, subfamily B, multidrug efflux pump
MKFYNPLLNQSATLPISFPTIFQVTIFRFTLMFRFFESLINPFPIERPATPPKSLYAFCRHYAKGTGPFLFAMAFFNTLIAIMEVSLFQFLGQLVDLLNKTTPDAFLAGDHQQLGVMSIVLLIGLPICVLMHSLFLHQTLLGNFPMRIRWQAHRYLLDQSYQFYQDEFAGRIATKVMQTALAVRETIMKLLDVLLYVIVYFTGIIVIAFTLDWRLSLPLFAWFFAYCGLLYYFLPKLIKISTRQADARSDMTGRLVDTYTNISTVKLFSHSNREADYARQGMEYFLTTVHPQMRLATQLGVSVWIINALLIFSMAAISVWLWTDFLVTTGAIAAAIGLVIRLNGMSHWIMWEVSALFENMGTVRDGLNTLTIPRKVQDRESAPPLQVSQSAIEFNDMKFNYGKHAGLFNDFNLKIKAGEKIGLVGRSGAGKSTLVNLLLRFFDLENGAIKIDGKNIADVQQESLRAQIGMVTQDTSLLHRSIRDNLIYGRPGATEDEMIHAAKLAEAHDFILSLCDNQGRKGYDAHVGERGVKLSGGQRQRIAIARVLIKNAPILILDEATSALDSEVEAAIQSHLSQLMQGKTVIAIAHRLSTIAAMDRLIVLDKGQIVEQGTHNELIALGGIYAQLWAHQSGGFLGEF